VTTTDPLSELLATAWKSLDSGDLEAAERDVERASSHSADDPEVVTLGGLLAASRGDIDRALAELERASALDPTYATPVINAVDIVLYSQARADEALVLCDRALERVVEEEELIDVILMKIDALTLVGERDDEVRELLGELDACSIDDPQACCRVGDVQLRLGELDAAQLSYQGSILRGELADARFGLGCVHEARDNIRAAIPEWLRCRELDALEPYPPHHITPAEFQTVAEDALAELPPVAVEKLANVAILIEDSPSPDLIREGLDPRLLGLFTSAERAFEGQALSIDTVQLFQRNLERVTGDHEHLADEIRITVLHETAHFFGLDEDALRELGLD
jgi:predicted Zn-dependent protease with MMP-like domain